MSVLSRCMSLSYDEEVWKWHLRALDLMKRSLVSSSSLTLNSNGSSTRFCIFFSSRQMEIELGGRNKMSSQLLWFSWPNPQALSSGQNLDGFVQHQVLLLCNQHWAPHIPLGLNSLDLSLKVGDAFLLAAWISERQRSQILPTFFCASLIMALNQMLQSLTWLSQCL